MLKAPTYCIAMSVAKECGDSAATINSNEEFMSGTAATKQPHLHTRAQCPQCRATLQQPRPAQSIALLVEAPYSMFQL